MITFRPGKVSDAIVTDGKCVGGMDPDHCTEYYGGRLVCESVDHDFRALITAAPDLLAACELGEGVGSDGPALLEYAAELVAHFAGPTANELRRKAKAERQAIEKAKAGTS